MNNLELLQRLVEESKVSDRQCSELLVLLNQVQYYVGRKAGMGDMFAQNLVEQMCQGKELSNVG